MMKAKKHSVEDLDIFKQELENGVPFETMKIIGDVAATPKESLLSHPVLQVLHERMYSRSKPCERNDPYKVALAIEGGGMRGCVSAGMTAALKDLGMEDCFDVVYGKPTSLPPPSPHS
jgi:hypothetical protein